MRESTEPFAISRKQKSLLNKKELDLVRSSSPHRLKVYSLKHLSKCLHLAREFRRKYRDLNQRQKSIDKSSKNLRTIQKLKIFDRLVSMYRVKYETKKIAERKQQAELDHKQHYDLDGVTQFRGNFEIQDAT